MPHGSRKTSKDGESSGLAGHMAATLARSVGAGPPGHGRPSRRARRLGRCAPKGAHPAYRLCHASSVIFRGGLGVIAFALWVYCILDVIMTDEHRVRNLAKSMWLMIVIFTFDVGAIAWLVAGQPPRVRAGVLPYTGNTGAAAAFPEYDRPGRFVPTNPDDDEAFLRRVRERAEEQRQAEAERRRRAQEKDKPATDPDTTDPDEPDPARD